jgi:PEP-CTERM motif
MFGKSAFRRMIPFALALLFSVGVGVAYGDNCNINTMPYWDGNITNGWLAGAQTFEAPSSTCNVLTEYEFELAGRSSTGSIQFNIYQWSSSGPVGSALYSTTLSWGTSASLFDVTNINLVLTPGQLYGADVDLLGYSGQSLYFNGNQTGYPGHDAWFYNPAYGGWNDFNCCNDYFLANFSSAGTTPEPNSILLFGSGLFAIAGVLRRKIRF